MPKLIAVEWDDQLARVVVARVTGSRVQVDRALEVALDGAQGTPAEALAARLAEAKIGKGDAIVNVGRTGTELRMLEVPRVPEEELPPVVRFQALRQFAAMTDDWKLDFIKQPVPETSEQLRVLAAAISPQLYKQIEAGCDASGLRPTRMLFRPFSLATMFNSLLPSEATRLCVVPIGDEADLLVLRGDELDLVRTTRLARNDEGQINTSQLISELRRTLMAYRSQPDASEIAQVVVCGSESELEIADQLHRDLKLEVTVFDPFQMVEVSSEAAATLGADRRRFAGLIGALLDTADFNDTRIDFLNARKPPVDDGNRRRNNLIAAVAALIVVSLIGAALGHNYLLNSKVKRLQQQVNNMKKDHKRVVQDVEDAKKIEEFVKQTNINWLDEISYVSQRLPANEVIINGIGGTTKTTKEGKGTKTTGTLQFQGKATSSQTVASLENRLRDEDRHSVRPGGRIQEIEGSRDYRWEFGENIDFSLPGEEKPEPVAAGENVASEEETSEETQDGPADNDAANDSQPLENEGTNDDESNDDESEDDDSGDDASDDDAASELETQEVDVTEAAPATDGEETKTATQDDADAQLDALRKLAEQSKKSEAEGSQPSDKSANGTGVDRT